MIKRDVLIRAMNDRGYEQLSQVASRANCSVSRLSEIISGQKPSIDMAVSICNALNIPFDKGFPELIEEAKSRHEMLHTALYGKDGGENGAGGTVQEKRN